MEGNQTVEIRIIKGGVPVSIFSSANATALDVLSFLPQFIDAIGLERLARKEGRTFEHPLSQSIGAVNSKEAITLAEFFVSPAGKAIKRGKLRQLLDVLEYSALAARKDIVDASPMRAEAIFSNLDRRIAAVRLEIARLRDTGALVD